MKLYGHPEGNGWQDEPISLSEASILATPAELRAIAKVLEELASEMEGQGFEHVHLSDRLQILADGPDLIVVKA